MPPSGRWIVWSLTVASTSWPATCVVVSVIWPRRAATVFSSSRSMGRPDMFVTSIVDVTRKLRVATLTRIVASYVALRSRLVASTEPGWRPSAGGVGVIDGGGEGGALGRDGERASVGGGE